MKYIVVDLEMNPVSRDYRQVRQKLKYETIEFGAVCLDDSYQLVEKFQAYVAPSYGKITRTITELTGITQDRVDGEPDFAARFNEFYNWVGDGEARIYSWSLSDLKQLQQECRYKLTGFNLDWLKTRWVDLQQEFDDRLGLHNNLALRHALGAMGVEFSGKAHTALDDAINTSAILALMQDEVKFRRTMSPVLDILMPKEVLTESIGDLFPELKKLQEDM